MNFYEGLYNSFKMKPLTSYWRDMFVRRLLYNPFKMKPLTRTRVGDRYEYWLYNPFKMKSLTRKLFLPLVE